MQRREHEEIGKHVPGLDDSTILKTVTPNKKKNNDNKNKEISDMGLGPDPKNSHRFTKNNKISGRGLRLIRCRN